MSNTAGLKWQNINANRKFPIRETDSVIDLFDNELPSDILVDLKICVPDTVDPYIGGVSAGNNNASIVIGDRNDTSNAIASVEVTNVSPYSIHPLNGSVSGVHGFVSFGPGIKGTRPRNWSFSAVQSPDLCESCVVKQKSPGSSISITNKKTGKELDFAGDIDLIANTPDSLKLSVEQVDIEGDLETAIVFSLNIDESGNELLEEYLCPGEVSPDNDNCFRTVINSINGVTPNCSGIINVEYQNSDDIALWFGSLPQGISPTNVIGFSATHDIALRNICRKPIAIQNIVQDSCIDPTYPEEPYEEPIIYCDPLDES